MVNQLVKEHISQYGTVGIDNKQLLQIIVGERAAHKISKLIQSFDLEAEEENLAAENIFRIASLPIEELMFRSGLTSNEAAKIVAAVSLGTRISMSETKRKLHRITNPEDLANYLSPLVSHLEYEVFGVVCFNAKHEIIANKIVSKGSATGAIVHPSMVILPAMAYKATAIAVYHPHPSGHCEPSNEDRILTKTLKEACKVCGIPLLDHIILSENGYFSFSSEGTI